MESKWLYVGACIAGLLIIYYCVYFYFQKRKSHKSALKNSAEKEQDSGEIRIIKEELSIDAEESDADLIRMIEAANLNEEEAISLESIDIQLIETMRANIDNTIDLLELNKIAAMTNRQPLSKDKIMKKLMNSERFK